MRKHKRNASAAKKSKGLDSELLAHRYGNNRVGTANPLKRTGTMGASF
jgi:hypothetical protein